jgi:Skp family chaperone for outer membrane proteins
MRRVLAVTLLLGATVAGAQAPTDPAKPSPGDACLLELPKWQNYVATLKTSRDQLEQDVATLRTELQRATAALDAAKKSAPKP